MAKILLIGCGDLGSAIAKLLHQSQANQHEVIGLRRSNTPSTANIPVIQADITQPNTLSSLSNLHPNIIIYCVSATQSTDESYLAHYVTGLKNILATQAQNTALQYVFFVSSSRVYGQTSEAILDENTPANPIDFGGERLLQAENLLNDLSCKSTKLRLSGIYGTGRLYLVNMAKDMAKWPTDNHWSNRIHRDDAAGFIAFLVNKVANDQPVSDCYIVTDDMPTPQYDVLTWLANQQSIVTAHIQTPPAQGGKRLSNKRLRDTGFNLRYPNYQVGYSGILKNAVV